MFKTFIKRIIEAQDKQEAVDNVFYGENGIDMAFQRDKLTFSEFKMLSDLIDKMA